MQKIRPEDREEAVLILAPTGGDAAVAAELLQETGTYTLVCETMMDVAVGLEHGAAALVIAFEALEDGGAQLLAQALSGQPAWSDVPVILLTMATSGHLPTPVDSLMDSVGNITLLERPFPGASLVSLVRVALRARRRQYEVRRLLTSERDARARAAWESRRADARERELRASEERFRLIANSIPQLAWMADPSGRLFWFNERWYEFAGADPNDPRAGWSSWIEAQDGQYLPVAEQRWRFSLASGVPFDMEFPMRRYDGQYRWFLTRAVPSRGTDGRPTLWFGTSTDITEHRETAQALRQSEERLLLAVETAQLGLWTLDPVRQELRCSDAFRLQIGRDHRSVTYDEFWRSVHPDDRAELEARVRDAMQAGEIVNSEHRILWPNGEARWILARARPVFGDDGSFVQLLGVSLDVTDRKLGEQRREVALEAERAARSEAERVARMKDEFLATLSHELRTPLNAVLGWSEVLQRAGAASPDFERGLSAITRNARLQAQLIEDLLDTSRIVSGALGLELTDVDMGEVVDAAIDSVQPSATARNVQILRSYAGAVHVRGDRRRLQQVAWNLLSNAVKFSRSGTSVLVSLVTDREQLRLEVLDRGEGIEPEFLPHLFERFRQQDSSRKRRSGGLGLGLSIVKHLVQLHGGAVAGHSEGAGTGAHFRVTLPRLLTAGEEARPDAAPEIETRLEVLGGARILVVDDEPDARELVARILRDSAAGALLAASADEALTMVVRDRPDLIVSDIGMPVRDGFDLIKDVRSLAGAESRTPAIALTAFARAEDRELALRSGFQRHLGKPVDSLALLTACADLLAARGARSRQSGATDALTGT
jgi:PAS domain S-box-containing protein